MESRRVCVSKPGETKEEEDVADDAVNISACSFMMMVNTEIEAWNLCER